MYGGGAYGSFAFGSEEEVPAVEEQSDDWWGVVGIKAASIALAGALAVSSSAAQANTRLINSLGEEITTYVAPPVVGDASAPSYRVGPAQPAVRYFFSGDDFIPQQATPPSVADSASPNYTVGPARIQVSYIFGSDDFPPPIPPPVGDSAFPAYSVSPPQAKVVYQFSGEDLPQQVIDQGDGLVWLSTAPAYKAPFIIFTQEDPPLLVTPPALPIAVESASPAYTIGPSRTVVRYIYGTEDLPIAAVVTPVALESGAPQYTLGESKTVVRYVFGNDEMPIAPLPSIAFEDDWAQPTPKYPLPRIIPPWVFGEVERVIPLPSDFFGILEGQVIGGPVMLGAVVGGSVLSGETTGGSVMFGVVTGGRV